MRQLIRFPLNRYPSVGVATIDARWEEMQAEENGMGVIPYVMSTSGLMADIEWEAEEIRKAVREFMADPRDSNIVTITNFVTMMEKGGQPDMPNLRQRVAWPPRQEDSREEEEEDGGKSDQAGKIVFPLFGTKVPK